MQREPEFNRIALQIRDIIEKLEAFAHPDGA
jgi:hypothetical protein